MDIKPIVPHGWTAKEITADPSFLRFVKRVSGSDYPSCKQCDAYYELGQKVILVKDHRARRRVAYCSVSCQRQGFFEGVAARAVAEARKIEFSESGELLVK